MNLSPRPVERSAERDALLEASLPHVARLGWTRAALEAGAADLGLPREAPEWLFPRGPVGALEAWCDLADRRMAEAAVLDRLRTAGRIRALVATRLRQAAPHKEVVRQGLATFSLPWNVRTATRTAARTADAMWNAAGDTSTGFSHHSRRASLGIIYGSVLAYWMTDESDEGARTLAFLDRQLARLATLQRPRPARA